MRVPDHPSGDAYLAGPPRQVPDFSSLHRMVGLLLAERVPTHGRVLVLGAGGGLEIRALADAYPDWSFDGVDPSRAMLDLAERTVGPHRPRVTFHHGTIASAPSGLWDGAVSLLTFHFIPREQRLDTLQRVRQRLKTGAPLTVAHISLPTSEPERSLWLGRHLAYAGSDPASVQGSMETMKSKLSILSPDEDAAMIQQAGFSDVSLFYAGLSFRGWVAYAA